MLRVVSRFLFCNRKTEPVKQDAKRIEDDDEDE
jgi:hypothetical protein